MGAVLDRTPSHPTLIHVFFKGIISADGEPWKFQKRQAAYVFSVKVFKEYSNEVFIKASRKIVSYLGKAADSGDPIDIQDVLFAFTLDIFGR